MRFKTPAPSTFAPFLPVILEGHAWAGASPVQPCKQMYYFNSFTSMILDGEYFAIFLIRILGVKEYYDVIAYFDLQNSYKKIAKYVSSSIMEVKPFPFFS